jgi:hypothetical protein
MTASGDRKAATAVRATPGPPWPRPCPALEVYAAGSLIDVTVASPRASQLAAWSRLDRRRQPGLWVAGAYGRPMTDLKPENLRVMQLVTGELD